MHHLTGFKWTKVNYFSELFLDPKRYPVKKFQEIQDNEITLRADDSDRWMYRLNRLTVSFCLVLRS